MHTKLVNLQVDLKSNMDRFIATDRQQKLCKSMYLKSNMDRFIGLRNDL